MAGEVPLANRQRTRHLPGSERNLKSRARGPTDCGCVLPAKTKVPEPRRAAVQVSPVRAAYAQGATGPNLFGEGEEKVGRRARRSCGGRTRTRAR